MTKANIMGKILVAFWDTSQLKLPHEMANIWMRPINPMIPSMLPLCLTYSPRTTWAGFMVFRAHSLSLQNNRTDTRRSHSDTYLVKLHNFRILHVASKYLKIWWKCIQYIIFCIFIIFSSSNSISLYKNLSLFIHVLKLALLSFIVLYYMISAVL